MRSRNKDALLSTANRLCESRWEAIRDDIQVGHYNPADVEDLARQGTAFADLAWALTLPEGEPGHLDVGEIMEALGMDAEAPMDETTARAVVVAFAEHGTMQTEAFTDYLRSGELANDVDGGLSGIEPQRGLRGLEPCARAAAEITEGGAAGRGSAVAEIEPEH